MLTLHPPTLAQVSVINGTSPFAYDYDLTHIVAAYQERNGESSRGRPLQVYPRAFQVWGSGNKQNWNLCCDENLKIGGLVREMNRLTWTCSFFHLQTHTYSHSPPLLWSSRLQITCHICPTTGLMISFF